MRRSLAVGLLGCVTLASAACDTDAPDPAPARRVPILYGHDDRQELFEVADGPRRARVELSVVALLRKEWVVEHDGGVEVTAPTRTELAGVCEDERFADQPAAAVCSGVLVDWDLILTASHCVRGYALNDLVVAFGYFNEAHGVLALQSQDLFEPVEIIAESIEQQNGRAVLDYAFVRLDRATRLPREPAPIRMSIDSAEIGDRLISAGASEGIPIKVDAGALIRQVRIAERDHFVADTDTAKGGSGGAAFDAELALLGVLFGGGEDLIEDGACLRTNRVSSDRAEERFAYAARAVDELCQQRPDESSLCRAACGDPCRALEPFRGAAGCSVTTAPVTTGLPWLSIALVFAAAGGRALTRRRCR